jgi:hypothetical protein
MSVPVIMPEPDGWPREAPGVPGSGLLTGARAIPQLTGTGRLADDLYLIAHSDVTGRPCLQPRALGLGLAGGLLAELMVAGQINARPRAVVATDLAPPEDRLAARVLRVIAAERGKYPAGEWLPFLARAAAGDIAARLGAAGYLSQVPSRRPWRGPRWVPADSDCAFAALTRARAALDPARPLTPPAAALAGLAAACGLGPRLLAYAPPRNRRSPEEAAAALPAGLRYLIAQTRAAVDRALLTHRI